MKNKKNIYALVFIALLLFTGCGKTMDAQETVNLYMWGDYMDESLLQEFTDETGIKVVIDYFSTNEDMYVKLKQGTNAYDVVCPSDYMIERMIREDMLLPLDKDKMAIPEIDERFDNLDYDPGNQYSVPYFWGTLGIIYDETIIGEPLTSFHDLWEEKYRDLIVMPNNQRDTIAIALKKLGYSMNTRDIDELHAAKDELVRQKHLVYAYLGDEIRDMILAGNAAIGVVYSGDAYLMHDENPDLRYVLPEEGTNLWVDAWVVPKNTQNPDGGMKLIEFLSRPENSAINSYYVYGYSTPYPEAIALLPEDYRESEIVFPSEEMLVNAEVYHDPQEFLIEYDRVWTYVLSSKE